MKMMRCSICGHVYNPDAGEGDVPAGTDFASLPETWTCPICMAAKDMFITV